MRMKLLPKGIKIFSKKQRLKLRNLCCFAPSSCKKDEGGRNEEQNQGGKQAPDKCDKHDKKHTKKGKDVVQLDTSVKGVVATKKPSIVLLSHLNNGTEDGEGIGIIIRKNVILTSHGTIPSVSSAKEGEMALSYPAMGCCPTQTTLKQKLLPSKFFITNPALDITAIACDDVSPVVPLNIELSQGRGPIGVDAKVYILGASQGSKPSTSRNLKVGEGRVTMEGDSIVKFSTEGEAWLSGSAGFTRQGQFAFMVCQPRRFSRAASMESSTSAASSSSQRRSSVKQSSVALREILRWLEDGMPSSKSPMEHHQQQAHHDRDRLHQHLQHNPKSPPPLEHDIEVRLSTSPCYHHLESPRSCASAGLNPRQPGISYPATPSTKSSPRCSPRRRSPNPRRPGVSYSISPLTSARSRRSSQTSSRRGSPCYRMSPPCCLSSGKRSPIPLSSCCLGRSYEDSDCDQQREIDDKFQDFLDSPEFEPPPCPLSGSSSEEDACSAVVYSSPRGRPMAATKKQIFKGPVHRPLKVRMSTDECGASDGEVYMGVGYMKHTHVSRCKANQKVGLPGYTVWHH
ncbi:hypothetical protein SELMODRAFT_410313 [Selaginella moellendorffii]|uniref:Uncharacterized protein n=1 Tax=Selaginella moellendorffii TaxID=88036 RepID=D8REC9_SELML|nr:hypothetical protein SELMODRAFT_410313 [Selaginella moellendorffii]